MKHLKLFSVSFICFCFMFFTSCTLDENTNGKSFSTESRTSDSMEYVIYVDTINEKIKWEFDGEKSFTIQADQNNSYLITGDPSLYRIELVDTDNKHLILTDVNNGTHNVYFDEDDDVIDEKPCCSRAAFKAWYNAFKENCEGNPECDVICAFAPCEISHYVAAAIACCYYGRSPTFFLDMDYEIVYAEVR